MLIAIPDELQLFRCLERLMRLQIPHCAFREPDRDNELTAIAAGPIVGDARKHFRRYRCLGAFEFG